MNEKYILACYRESNIACVIAKVWFKSFVRGSQWDPLPHYCEKSDIKELEKFYKTGMRSNEKWERLFLHIIKNKTISVNAAEELMIRINSKSYYTACSTCGELADSCYKRFIPTASNRYRLLSYNQPKTNVESTHIFVRYELEHWRLRNEKLLSSMARYWNLDDRLLEQLFDKLLEVLPFEIVYIIMY